MDIYFQILIKVRNVLVGLKRAGSRDIWRIGTYFAPLIGLSLLKFICVDAILYELLFFSETPLNYYGLDVCHVVSVLPDIYVGIVESYIFFYSMNMTKYYIFFIFLVWYINVESDFRQYASQGQLSLWTWPEASSRHQPQQGLQGEEEQQGA